MLRTISLLLAGLLLLSAGLAYADPPDPDAFLLDSQVVYARAPYRQYEAVTAWDGTNYLVVWQDGRTDHYGYDIYAARVDGSGRLLDSCGFNITDPLVTNEHPRVAFDGTNYFVVWDAPGGAICGTRVSRSGQVLDEPPIKVSPISAYAADPSIAFDGTNYLVAWQQDNTDIYAARLNQSGIVLDPSGFAVSRSSGYQCAQEIAFGDSNYLVIWTSTQDGVHVYGARVTPSGVVLDTAGIPITVDTARTYGQSVAFGGDYFLVTWDRVRNYQTDVFATRVTRSGVVLDSGGIPVATTDQNEGAASVTFGSPYYLVAFNGPQGASGCRIDQSGGVLDPDGFRINRMNGGLTGQAAVFDGTNFWVVWDCYEGEWRQDVFGARLTPDANVLDTAGVLVSSGVYEQSSPCCASDGTDFLVAWQDYRRGPICDIYASRVSSQGSLLDPRPFTVSQGTYPSVAACSICYLVAWEDWREGNNYSDIYAARVSPSGHVLDTSGIAVAIRGDFQFEPAVAACDTAFLVVWQHEANNMSDDIYAARVNGRGRLLDPNNFVVSMAPPDKYEPAVAFDGTDYLITWVDTRRPDTLPHFDIYGARVTQAGVVLDTAGIEIAAGENNLREPAIAYGGGSYLVVWTSGDAVGVYAARVTRSGTVLDTAGLAVSTDPATEPTATFDGTDYIVAWQAWSMDSTTIHGARVSTSGAVLDTFPVTRGTGSESLPALTSNAAGHVLATWDGWTDSIGGRVTNTTRIWGKLSPFVGLADGHKAMGIARTVSARPNPFRTSLLIHMTTGPLDHSTTSARIYDAAGRLIASSSDPYSALVATPSGYVWKPSSDIRAGVYVVRVKTVERTATTRVVFAP
ncbi:MAG: T9SS type A sorting domain-containing protein [candidate division WOR-3 bacterium]|nr:T9SS type A sorting domain-containing protein [candidate division WOR-3 bacterium]